jgi:hypothetical protein
VESLSVSRTPAEWVAEFALDPTRRVLFVEGERDLAFWRAMVPYKSRTRSVVYPAKLLHVESCVGGERGRAVFAANAIANEAQGVRFFLDADHDRLLAREGQHPSCVVLTDGRDLEAYAWNQECLERLLDQFARRAHTSEIQTCIERICRPIGLLRMISDSENLRLPFQRTLTEGANQTKTRLTRYIDGKPTPDVSLDLKKLIEALLQNADQSLKHTEGLVAQIEREEAKRKDVGSGQIVHGKDMTSMLSLLLGTTPAIAESLLFLSIRREEVLAGPKVTELIDWLEG